MVPLAQLDSLGTLNRTASFLRGKTNSYAWAGLGIAIAALLIAMLLSCYTQFGSLSLDYLLQVQKVNPALWLLDAMPLLFLAWGQHIGTVMSFHAGAMLLDETRALREQTSQLEYALDRSEDHSPLTDLPNQRNFASKLGRVIARRREHGGSCAVLVVDTQQYHEVALAHGEAAAREFISQLSQRLQSSLTQGSIIGHFGYDDFALLIRNVTGEPEALGIARRIQMALDTPLHIRREPMSLRSSVGVAIYPDHGEDAEALIRHAQTAKYAATAAGLDCLVYCPDLENARSETPRLVAEMHAALDHEGLAADYLPQQPLKAGLAPRLRMISYWLHPRRGRLDQAEFLALPGRPSLIHSLTLWQLREACAHLAAARREINPQMVLSLRLADGAYAEFPLVESVTGLLRAHDLPGSALTLELRESALQGSSAALEQLQALRNEGVHICLTGIGGPCASPACILYFPLNEAQLVPELLMLARDQDTARRLLESTVLLLTNLGARVTACGVDTPELLALVQSTGVDYAEGLMAQAPPATTPDAQTTQLAAPPENRQTDFQIVL
jgi:diguanylate cyclase (GGDEF)-like protein